MQGFKVIFLMMDNSFVDEVYETWLGVLLGAELWYPLWEPSTLNETVVSLLKIIKGQDNMTTMTEPLVCSVCSKKQEDNLLDYEVAFSLLKPNFAALPLSLSAIIEELGINDANDLSHAEQYILEFLPNLLKPIQKKKFKDALKIN